MWYGSMYVADVKGRDDDPSFVLMMDGGIMITLPNVGESCGLNLSNYYYYVYELNKCQ